MRSVVLATYQGAQYIDAQLDSILSQLAVNDEVVVSDDASTDDTVQIVMRRNDPRVVLLDNQDRVGYIKNFERAIRNSSGDRILFSDQDDIWLPNKVSMISEALDKKACAVSDSIIVDMELQQLHPSYFEWREANSFSFFSVFLKPCFIGATMACRRDYLETLLPFPPKVPHDFWIALNAIWDGNLEVLREPLILYRRHPATASVSATRNKRAVKTIFGERIRLAKHILFKRMALRVGSGRPSSGRAT